MNKSLLVLVGLCSVVLAGCASTQLPPTPQHLPAHTRKCPPPGSEVPFSRLVNPAFNADYIDCDVMTTAYFLNIKTGTVTLPSSVIDTAVIIAATDANETTQAYVVVDKKVSDLLFELRPKDKIKLAGENRVVMFGSRETCYFAARTVTREP